MASDQSELVTVQAEVIALQAVLLSVFRKLATRWPETRPIFCSAFDDAETILSGVIEQVGADAPSEVTLGSLRIVEELRRAIIQDEDYCSTAEGRHPPSRGA